MRFHYVLSLRGTCSSIKQFPFHFPLQLNHLTVTEFVLIVTKNRLPKYSIRRLLSIFRTFEFHISEKCFATACVPGFSSSFYFSCSLLSLPQSRDAFLRLVLNKNQHRLRVRYLPTNSKIFCTFFFIHSRTFIFLTSRDFASN